MRKFLVALLVPISFTVFSQRNIDRMLEGLYQVDTLPSGLLMGKTFVLVNTPDQGQEEWDKVTGVIHQNMVKAGIDAVGYYRFDSFFAGAEVSRSFALDMKQREIKTIVLVKHTESSSTVAVVVPSYNDEIIEKDQPAWVRTGKLKEIMNGLYVSAANSKLERTNFLINDVPERGIMTKPIKGRRATFFSIVLNKNKLAVPKMPTEQENNELVALLGQVYPYSYELVEPGMTELELVREGYQFILHYVTAPLLTTREILGYKNDEGVNAYMSAVRVAEEPEMKMIRANEVVFKYYIKHVRTGTTYLGNEWDADTTWKDALRNHINSLISQTKNSAN